MSRNKSGQSTLEYVIIWTAIVAAVLITAKAALQPAVDGAVRAAATKVTAEVTSLTEGLGK